MSGMLSNSLRKPYGDVRRFVLTLLSSTVVSDHIYHAAWQVVFYNLDFLLILDLRWRKQIQLV